MLWAMVIKGFQLSCLKELMNPVRLMLFGTGNIKPVGSMTKEEDEEADGFYDNDKLYGS